MAVVPPPGMTTWQDPTPFSSDDLDLIRQLDVAALKGYQCRDDQACTLGSKLNHPWEECAVDGVQTAGLTTPVCKPGVYNLFGPARTHKSVSMFVLALLARERRVSFTQSRSP